MLISQLSSCFSPPTITSSSATLIKSRVFYPFLKSRATVFLRNVSSTKMSSVSDKESISIPSETVNTVEEKKPTSDVVVQYVVLRRDLIDSWPLGSVVTQGCHASVAAIWSNKDDAHTIDYCSPDNIDSMHKVTLEVKGETQIQNLSQKLTTNGIAHKLWIEQPENFPTCLATKPYPKSVVSSFFKNLKLCK
ncbi:hypothetical protein C5167_015550 [Papaver somniferum]|uniref:peptidyl-tRNA hydrolase n=2 Tax=Papaver somniferum TaxID=3469 RepID=A0A4Y7J9T6_PAPSO|nr:hypothetical protein C5167_015550 [Papaver somniferum]